MRLPAVVTQGAPAACRQIPFLFIKFLNVQAALSYTMGPRQKAMKHANFCFENFNPTKQT
jgi:hypothetical protein